MMFENKPGLGAGFIFACSRGLECLGFGVYGMSESTHVSSFGQYLGVGE
ncbi:hypothetical protein PFWH6_1011 [Pseudomonas fluorescens WH6]|nr:hypothetical protein PFWH6_1011 [Pseudomonas fluorescens WH6]